MCFRMNVGHDDRTGRCDGKLSKVRRQQMKKARYRYCCVFVYLHWWHFLQAVLSLSLFLHAQTSQNDDKCFGWMCVADCMVCVGRRRRDSFYFVFRFSLYATTLLLRSEYGLLFSANDDDYISFSPVFGIRFSTNDDVNCLNIFISFGVRHFIFIENCGCE